MNMTEQSTVALPVHTVEKIATILNDELGPVDKNAGTTWDEKTRRVLSRLNEEGFYISTLPDFGGDQR